MKETHILLLEKNKNKKKLTLFANDGCHAQAQAQDICRAFEVDKYQLTYGFDKEESISVLFKRLAFNDFVHSECVHWAGSFCNDAPCMYVFKNRFYVKNVILKYLEISKDDYVVKHTCKNKSCINPYHYLYTTSKNSKLTGGDRKMVVAYLSQGASIQQVAKALNVHRSTIYRNLNHECFSTRPSSNCSSAGGRQ
jgi:hypothetical protein